MKKIELEVQKVPAQIELLFEITKGRAWEIEDAFVEATGRLTFSLRPAPQARRRGA